ncbi:hypothetical protein LPB67_09760 [Undibacterium sp. Jales W-56]|uniref:hypothetical protein n=1 Tax=Undibacterium sp. Jales W-56 TaxID=2897325 RepID=UPI0021CF63E3|nr:hypothetical protein [Undibacterium sp. Jales W-56]MCU6434051.1 hypothetical protein [Undibacterium sp. Jales W-56]
MSKLLDYLNILDKDAAAREAHKKDPKGAMKKFGLSDHEQEAFISGDKKRVAKLIGVHEDTLPAIQMPQFAA